eukprot:8298277-Pyramimonas_sp.AAC.1
MGGGPARGARQPRAAASAARSDGRQSDVSDSWRGRTLDLSSRTGVARHHAVRAAHAAVQL